MRELEARFCAEEDTEQRPGALGGKRLGAELSVERLGHPAVLVLRAIVDEEQDSRGGQRVHQAVEEGLGLRIAPVEVFDHEQQRLDLALPDKETLARVDGLFPALRRIEALPRAILHEDVEHCEQGGEARQQGLVQRHDLPADLLADLPDIVPPLDLEVGAEQPAEGQIRGGLAMRHRSALQHEPPLGAGGADELPKQARLPYAWLADHRHDLAGPAMGALQRVVELRQLGLAPDETREAARGGGVQARPRVAGGRELKHLHWRGQALHRPHAERLHRHEALGEAERLRGDEDRARARHLLHARGQVRRLPDRRIVHAKVAPD